MRRNVALATNDRESRIASTPPWQEGLRHQKQILAFSSHRDRTGAPTWTKFGPNLLRTGR